MTISPTLDWLPLEGSGLTVRQVHEARGVTSLVSERAGGPRALLAEHPSGTLTWHFPPAQADVPQPDVPEGSRVHELAVSRARSVAGWERRERGYAVRRVSTAPVARATTTAMTERDLAQVSGDRVLLLVHGLLSLTATAFPVTRLRRVFAAYDHVLALDHPTVTRDPAQNARELLRRLPAGLTVDILSHSRGGLVSRALAGELADAPAPYRVDARSLTVRRLVMMGTPNVGSAIGDPGRAPAFLSRLTTLLRWLDGPTDVLEGVLQLVGELARKGQDATLPGIAAMAPGSDFLTALNRPQRPSGTTQLYAVTTDFEPSGSLPLALVDAVTDGLLGAEPNDGLVPTAGVGSAPDGDFPVPRPRTLDVPSRHNVWHLTYVHDDHVVATLQRWLTG